MPDREAVASAPAPAFADEIHDAAAAFLDRRFPAGLPPAAGGWDVGTAHRFLSELEELGWSSLLASGAAGGLDAGAAEVRALFRAVGRRPVPAPLLDLVITGPVLRRSAGPADGVPGGLVTWTGRATRTGADRSSVSGAWPVVDGADLATAFLVQVDDPDPAVVLVRADAAGVSVRRRSGIDACARPCEVSIAGAEGTVLLRGERARAWLGEHRRLRQLAVAAESAGVAQWCVDASTRYAKQRVQFGRPIGSFQSLAHLLAEMWTDAYALDSLCEWACAPHDASVATRLAIEAKALAAEYGQRVVHGALQVHGAIGYTDELPLSLYFKRALTLAGAEGERDDLFAEAARGDLAATDVPAPA